MQTEISISAGLVIIQDNKILLCHPTGAKWLNTYSIPKGQIDIKDDKNLFNTALREFGEEIGIFLNRDKLIINNSGVIKYTNGDIEYKKVYYFVCQYEDKIKIDLNNLQKAEIDWAGFLTIEEAKSKIFWRLKEVLNYLK